MKWWKLVLLIAGLFVVSFFVYLYIGINGSPMGKSAQKKQMQAYLEKKYDQSFTVYDVSYNGLGAGYYGTASPTSNSDLRFDVSVSVDENAGYADLYPVEFWKTKDAESIKEDIKTIFPDLDESKFTLDRKLEEQLGPYVPELTSVHYDAGYSGVLTIAFNEDWFLKTESEQQNEMKKINRLADYLQKKHFPVLVLFFYETENIDHRKGIYLTQDGKIVELTKPIIRGK